jgi:hypothetical protein
MNAAKFSAKSEAFQRKSDIQIATGRKKGAEISIIYRGLMMDIPQLCGQVMGVMPCTQYGSTEPAGDSRQAVARDQQLPVRVCDRNLRSGRVSIGSGQPMSFCNSAGRR